MKDGFSYSSFIHDYMHKVRALFDDYIYFLKHFFLIYIEILFDINNVFLL